MKTIFGRHVVVDGYAGVEERLQPDVLFDLFDRLVEELHMEYLQRPIASRVPVDPSKLNGPDDEGGWSVICQITTSHIAIHTWPLRLAFMMDIFSCCEFNAERAVEIVCDHLWALREHVRVQNIERSGPLADT